MGKLDRLFLMRVTYLDLEKKGLVDIRPLSYLVNLRQVNLRRNRLNSLSALERLPHLNAVYIRDNPDLTLPTIRMAKKHMTNVVLWYSLK